MQTLKSFFVQTLSITLLLAGTTQAAYAGFVTTENALAIEQRQTLLSEVEARLATDQVQQALLKLGVPADQVAARVAALSNAELTQINAQLDAMPAGAGVIEVVGVVFIVLLILELVGVTDIFTAI